MVDVCRFGDTRCLAQHAPETVVAVARTHVARSPHPPEDRHSGLPGQGSILTNHSYGEDRLFSRQIGATQVLSIWLRSF